ncbi:RDD family protein [Paraburkholderia bonniea]|uniref:RDD family protein n=1 Tax=Paraburkholderia bonniea TaxID=2152891 RepID=UPI001292A1E1|nr:RDD family protein [Paraburkholderia bonniea]WJF91610.1 RDD family protein [Paraburkholderia bonniea]WJF94929.1 RDD family protein [Paraburkholderia bonniea]
MSTLLASAPVPTVRRRLAALLYEAVILFGVVFIAGFLFSILTQQRNGLVHHNLLAGWIAFVVGLYFVWFWCHGGQTLPMKTWRLRVVCADGSPLSTGRAMLRYGFAWLWLLPPLALHPLLGLALPQTLAVSAGWFLSWAATGCIGPNKQFLHDRMARTRIILLAR